MLVAASDAESRPDGGVATDVILAAAGDARAFERLYRAHADRVFSLCARMTGDRVTAEELTQDVFVRAWEKLGQFRGESAFGTWLHRLAVNVILGARKRDRRGASLISSDEEPDGIAARVGHQPGEIGDLEGAIAKLPGGARRVFVLHDVEGYRHEEIGSMLGITSGGSKAQLHRARQLLREALAR